LGRGDTLPARESARDRIHRVAARLYALRGFEGTSIREIAEGAGVTKPLVHYHFESKERLFGTLLSEALDRCRLEAAGIVCREAGAGARLRALIGALVREARQSPEIVCFALQVLTMAKHLPLGFDYKARGRDLFDMYVRVIAEGQSHGEFRPEANARYAASVAIGTIDFITKAVLSGELDAIPVDLEEFVSDMLQRGLEARAS